MLVSRGNPPSTPLRDEQVVRDREVCQSTLHDHLKPRILQCGATWSTGRSVNP
jgi:hypothetical protein